MADYGNILDEAREIEAKKAKAGQETPFPRQNAAPQGAGFNEPEKQYETYGGEVKLKQEIDDHNCASCGGNMAFDPATQKLACPYCGGTTEVAVDRNVAERDLDFSLDKAKTWNDETRVFKCANCGGETVFDKSEFAKNCIFCGSASVTKTENLEGIRPGAVLPFAFDRVRAEDFYKKWVKSKLLAPGAFRRGGADVDHMKAYYAPSWTFNSDTYSYYKGVVGDYYYVTVGSGKNRHTERRVRYRNVSGNYAKPFENVHINSGEQLEEKTFEKLKPFAIPSAVVYDKTFLAGFSAEHYKRPLNSGWAAARYVIDREINSGVRRSIRADVIKSLVISTQYNKKTFKYLLLPLFVAHFTYRGKNFKTFINGVTGKTVGGAPVSGGKVALLVGIILGVVAAIGAAAYFLLG